MMKGNNRTGVSGKINRFDSRTVTAVKRGLALLLAVMLTAGMLTGCQLAKEDAGEEQQRDRLAGVFVTQDRIDFELFNTDDRMRDGAEPAVSGGSILEAGDRGGDRGRLYASLVERTLYDEDGQPVGKTWDYVFEGIKGVRYFSAVVNEGDGNSTQLICADPAVCGGENNLSITDEGETIRLEGTIYVTTRQGQGVFTVYPVYQTPDGRVYLVQGSSIAFDLGGECVAMSEHYEEKRTVTGAGETRTEEISVKITLETVDCPERVAVSQLDAESRLVSRIEYAAGQVPDKLIPEESAEYIVVELYKKGVSGESIERQICGREDSGFNTLASGEDGMCEQEWCELEWR